MLCHCKLALKLRWRYKYNIYGTAVVYDLHATFLINGSISQCLYISATAELCVTSTG